jgi:ABC-type transport system substrate-binding protein
MSPRRTAAALGALTVLLLLAGCTPTPKEDPAMTPHEARDQLVKTVKDTAARLTVGGWKEDSAPDVGACDGDVPSVDYGYGYGAAPGTDHLADAQKVAEYWKTLGMTVRVETSPDPVVFATGGPVKGVSFSTAPGNYYISGTSLCVPGDIDTLTDEQAG